MKHIVFIEPTILYNLLNQVSYGTLCMSREYYLVLFDVRKAEEYEESHVVISRHVPFDVTDGFKMPKNIDYSAVKNLVVIDNRASNMKEVTSPAVLCAEMLWKMGSKSPVQVVKGGYEEFSALYPFLRTRKMLWTSEEIASLQTYPIEVEPGFLYIGVYEQAQSESVSRHLKIKGHVNVTTRCDTKYSTDQVVQGKRREMVPQLFNVPIEDDVNANIYTFFKSVCSFIDHHDKNDGKSVLVYSDLGVSRCVTVAVAFLMFKHKWSLKDAVAHVRKCHHSICPNQRFIGSLFQWEKEVLGCNKSKPQDLGFLSYD